MARVRSPESECLRTANAVTTFSKCCAASRVRTRMLWAGPALFAILGGTILFVTLKRRRGRGGAHDLSAAERSRVERLIDGEH